MARRRPRRRFIRRTRKSRRAMSSRFGARVRKVLRRAAESKVAYGYTNSTFGQNTGLVQGLVPSIAQGVGYYQRIGSQIEVKNFIYRAYLVTSFTGSGTPTQTFNKVRVAYIRLKQVPTSLTIAGLMEDTLPAYDPNYINSSWDPEYVTVISDKTYMLNATPNQYMNTGCKQYVMLKLRKKWLCKWAFQTSSTDVGSDPTKFIYLVIWGDQPSDTWKITLNGTFRYSFTDL